MSLLLTSLQRSGSDIAWWRYQMETFSALLALCAGNSPVTGEFPAQRPVTRSFNVFFDLRLNKRLSKQSWGWWFETPSRPLWPIVMTLHSVYVIGVNFIYSNRFQAVSKPATALHVGNLQPEHTWTSLVVAGNSFTHNRLFARKHWYLESIRVISYTKSKIRHIMINVHPLMKNCTGALWCHENIAQGFLLWDKSSQSIFYVEWNYWSTAWTVLSKLPLKFGNGQIIIIP